MISCHSRLTLQPADLLGPSANPTSTFQAEFGRPLIAGGALALRGMVVDLWLDWPSTKDFRLE